MSKRTKTIINIFVLFAVTAVLFFIVKNAYAAIAMPEGDTGLRVNLGEPIQWAGTVVVGAVSYLIAALVGFLPGPARWAVKLTQIDQVLNAIIRAWVSKNAGKVASSASWTLDLRNTAVRDMVAMALNTGNKHIKSVRDTLEDKLHARLQKYIEDQAK